jgi:CRP/FNR family transcriptional regulator
MDNYLKNKILNSKHMYITHNEFSSDPHISRLVISRLLKKMENQNKINLKGSCIGVL